MEEESVASQKSFWAGVVDYVDDWTFMSNPLMMLLILISYLFFVLYCGPKFMKSRPAYKLNNVLLFYNAFQVAYSFYLCSIGIPAILEQGVVETGCALNDESKKYRIVNGHYLYFLAKMTELLDTVFFVMRKKWNQVSFLHVYHHSVMYFAAWTTLKYEPTYSLVFLGTINSFVHVIMYTYYGLSSFPGLKKYLWWKKYLTKIQLIQFLIVLMQVTLNHKTTKCPTSYLMLTIVWAHGFLFIYLFSKFYIESYMKKRRENKEKFIKDEKTKRTMSEINNQNNGTNIALKSR